MEKNNELETFLERMTGSSDTIARQYLNSLLIEMRLVGAGLASTETEAFGVKLDTPITLGTFGGYDKLGEDALFHEAEAAAELNTLLWLNSHMSDEDIARCIGLGAKVVKVVKPYQDNERLLAEFRRAEDMGCVAVATDLDHAFSKVTGDYDRDGKDGTPFGPKSAEELSALAQGVGVPLVVKGVLSVHDAVQCKEAGVRHILLSHHHNIMDYSVPPVMLLPDIRKAVGEDMTILVDCGMDTGADVFKALALGADLVCTARAVMRALRQNGRQGVVDLIRGNTVSLRHFMNRTGSPDVKHIDPTVIHKRNF